MVDPAHKAIMENKYHAIYEPCHIGLDVDIKGFCNVGRFAEINGFVKIGNYVRVGMGCFICDGVTLEDYVFLAPRVTFCHDPKVFPSGGRGWVETLVKAGARIGAGAIILGGVTIGENAIIGAGAVVTQDVPDGETWAGNPARKISHDLEP